MRIKVSRNLWIAFVVIALALMLVSQPQTTLAAEKFKLKFQATWTAGSTLYENFLMFADQVKKMSGGRLEIETLPAGAVVPPFEVLDAVSRGVLDGGHAWASYWAGKSKVAVLFTGGPGGTFGMDFTDYLGWMFEGGGLELYNEFYQKQLKLKVVPYPIMFAGPQSLGWFKKPIRSWDDFKGVKYRVEQYDEYIAKHRGKKGAIPMVKRHENLILIYNLQWPEFETKVEDLEKTMRDRWKKDRIQKNYKKGQYNELYKRYVREKKWKEAVRVADEC